MGKKYRTSEAYDFLNIQQKHQLFKNDLTSVKLTLHYRPGTLSPVKSAFQRTQLTPHQSQTWDLNSSTQISLPNVQKYVISEFCTPSYIAHFTSINIISEMHTPLNKCHAINEIYCRAHSKYLSMSLYINQSYATLWRRKLGHFLFPTELSWRKSKTILLPAHKTITQSQHQILKLHFVSVYHNMLMVGTD